jgi:hypothetical protein
VLLPGWRCDVQSDRARRAHAPVPEYLTERRVGSDVLRSSVSLPHVRGIRPPDVQRARYRLGNRAERRKVRSELLFPALCVSLLRTGQYFLVGLTFYKLLILNRN